MKGVALLLSQRNTTPLFGAGLIDSISTAELEQVAMLESREQPSITGRVLGRFGWRGQSNELSDFIRGGVRHRARVASQYAPSGS